MLLKFVHQHGWMPTYILDLRTIPSLVHFAHMCVHHQSSPVTLFTQQRFVSLGVPDLGATLGALRAMAAGQRSARRWRLGSSHSEGSARNSYAGVAVAPGDSAYRGPGRVTLSGRAPAELSPNRLAVAT
jgi:hypothetical protein